MKFNFKEILFPTVAMLIICLVSAFLLAGTNWLTADKIAENMREQEIKSRKLALPDAKEFSDEKEIIANENTVKYCVALDENGEGIGYVFTCVNKGYGGDISVMTAVDNNGKVIRSVVLSMDDETPGVGQKAGKAEFLDMFIGKSGVLSWVKNGGSEQQIQGVSSATYTSKAVIQCVNDALKAFSLLGGEA